jgi:hypothetical protein
MFVRSLLILSLTAFFSSRAMAETSVCDAQMGPPGTPSNQLAHAHLELNNDSGTGTIVTLNRYVSAVTFDAPSENAMAIQDVEQNYPQVIQANAGANIEIIGYDFYFHSNRLGGLIEFIDAKTQKTVKRFVYLDVYSGYCQ